MSFSPSPRLVFLAWESHSGRMPMQRAVCDQQYGSPDIYQISNQKLHRTHRQKRCSNGHKLGRLGLTGGVSPSALTSSCGRRLMRIRSAFSLSCLLSMRARSSLEALSWRGEALARGSRAQGGQRPPHARGT